MAETRQLHFPPHALWETRAGSGTPLLLVHGLSGSSKWWSKNLDALAQRHLVAAVDLVGFGANRRFLGPPRVLPSFSEVTALLARWIESFREPVHLVGHSMGGQISIRLAAERPDLLRSLVLVDAAGLPFRLDPRPHLRALPQPPYGGGRIMRVLLPDFLRAGPASVAIAGARVLTGDMRDRLRAIETPTLIVWGASDPLVPLPYGEAMQREIAGSELVVLPRAAHVPMWDAPEAFNRALLDWTGRIETSPVTARSLRFSWGISGWTDGIAHRQSGSRRDIVLIHGLGMSSRYLGRLARSLFKWGWNPIAPDLPGFGHSNDAAAAGAEVHAATLERWADSLGIRGAAWVGHSFGCNIVERLAERRPDLVGRIVLVGALWTRRRFPQLRFMAHLALDAMREPLSLFRYVLRAYWRAGAARWWLTWRRTLPDLRRIPEFDDRVLLICGDRDPIPDRTVVKMKEVPGAHACLFSNPEAVAELITESSVISHQRRPADA